MSFLTKLKLLPEQLFLIQVSRKLTGERHYLIKAILFEGILKAHCLRKTAVWVRPSLINQPQILNIRN